MKERHFFENPPSATNFLFDHGMESGMERPQCIKIGFEINNVNEQTHDASTFNMMNVTDCFCKNGSEFFPDDRTINNYGAVLIIVLRLLKILLILIKILMDYLIILNIYKS